jgi:hypothetical protein
MGPIRVFRQIVLRVPRQGFSALDVRSAAVILPLSDEQHSCDRGPVGTAAAAALSGPDL